MIFKPGFAGFFVCGVECPHAHRATQRAHRPLSLRRRSAPGQRVSILQNMALIAAKAVGVIVALCAVLVALYYFTFRVESRVTNWATVPSPDGMHELSVTVGSPEFAYSAHTVTITIAGKWPLERSQRLYNDGANLSERNIEIAWRDDRTATVCLRGQEQANQLVTLSLPEQRTTVQDNGC